MPTEGESVSGLPEQAVFPSEALTPIPCHQRTHSQLLSMTVLRLIPGEEASV
jgi:hypothetical protein